MASCGTREDFLVRSSSIIAARCIYVDEHTVSLFASHIGVYPIVYYNTMPFTNIARSRRIHLLSECHMRAYSYPS